MKIRVPNELFFTVFFGKENASERMRGIFKEFYGDIDRAFTNIPPEVLYDSKIQNNHEHTLGWN